MEDEKGRQITSPLIVVPPVQRIEPSAIGRSQNSGDAGAGVAPQDREALFITTCAKFTPQTTNPNTLQIALQTRIKVLRSPGAVENRYAASTGNTNHPSASGQWLSGEQHNRLLRGVKVTR